MHFLKKFQGRYIHFVSGILFTITLALAYSNDYSLETLNDSVLDQSWADICFYDSRLCQACPFGWSVRFLYLKPNIDDSHYVISAFDNTFEGSLFPTGKRHQNSTRFAPGFIVESLYTIDSDKSFLSFCFTYFKSSSNNSVTGDFLYDTNGFPGFGAQGNPLYTGTARSKNNYSFYAGNVAYNRTLLHFFPENLNFIFGLQIASIKFLESTTSSGTFINNQLIKPLENHLKRDSQFCGLGPEFGIDYQFLFSKISPCFNALSFRAQTRCSLLCGSIKSHLDYVTLRTGPGGIHINNGDSWRVVPSACSELGIEYTLNCKCLNLTFELGYEFSWYNSCINKITGLDVFFAGDTIDVFQNFSLHGPYFRIGGHF